MLYFYFREYYVLWHIAMGGKNRAAVNAKIRLHVYVSKTQCMDEVSVNELYSFLIKMMDSEVSIKGFHSLLRTYKYAIMCRERTDGSLRGVMLMGVDKRELNGLKYTLIRLGLAFFQNYYSGGPLLYYVTAYHILKQLILHPLTPLFVVGKAFSYKSYLLMCNYCSLSYPRYDRETPQFAKEVINEFAKSCKSPSEEYDEETFVLKREKTRIRPGLVEVTEKELKNPNIKFFVERNPGWAKGHQLMLLGEFRWQDFGRMVWKSVMRAVRARRGPDRPKKRQRLTRLYSYQNEEFRRYSTTYSEMDVVGGRNDHVAEDDTENSGIYTEELYSYDIYKDL